jgi:plastocyanin
MILIGLIAIAGLVAASTFSVNQRADTATLFAERNSIGEGLIVESAPIWVTNAARGASGLQASPVEIGAANVEARPAIAADMWVYSVTLREATAASVAAGVFTAELFIDEVSTGTVFVTQATADPAIVESVRLSFPIGPTLSTSSLYYLVVKPFVETGPTVTFVVQSNPNENPTWVSVGGSEVVVNPTFTAPVGATIRITGRIGQGDTMAHNIGAKLAGTFVTSPNWSPDFEGAGDEEMVSFIASSAGDYKYQCKYHPSMIGTITVA